VTRRERRLTLRPLLARVRVRGRGRVRGRVRGRDSGRVRASRARLPAAAISEQLRRLLSRRLQRLGAG